MILKDFNKRLEAKEELKIFNCWISGYSNTSSHILSAKTNIKNYKAVKTKSSQILLYCPNGSIRTYFKSQYDDYYYLRTEKLPNGNQKTYHYDKCQNISRITTSNPKGDKIYASIDLTYSHPASKCEKKCETKHRDKYDFRVVTSDNEVLDYKHTTYKMKKVELIKNKVEKNIVCLF